jgi:hypothetical protein
MEAWSFSAGLGALLWHFCHSASCLFSRLTALRSWSDRFLPHLSRHARHGGRQLRGFSRISEGFRSKDSAAKQFIGGHARQLASERNTRRNQMR